MTIICLKANGLINVSLLFSVTVHGHARRVRGFSETGLEWSWRLWSPPAACDDLPVTAAGDLAPPDLAASLVGGFLYQAHDFSYQTLSEDAAAR